MNSGGQLKLEYHIFEMPIIEFGIWREGVGGGGVGRLMVEEDGLKGAILVHFLPNNSYDTGH